MKSLSRAFTLMELLFVVSIIAILASISVPNFLEAQIRSKISRTRSDLSALSLAHERYYTDHGVYLPNHPQTRLFLDAALQNPIMDEAHTSVPDEARVPWFVIPPEDDATTMTFMDMSFAPTADEGLLGLRANQGQLDRLTSPVAYIRHQIGRDPFGYTHSDTFQYVNTSELFSDDTKTSWPGLWGDHVTSQTYYYMYSVGPDGDESMWHPLSGPWISYDPTNGTTSGGEIWHVEGRAPEVRKPDEAFRPSFMGSVDNSAMTDPGWF